MPPGVFGEEGETLVGLFALAAIGALLGWLLAGGRRRPRAEVPEAIEDRIDHVVLALNERFGKDWGRIEPGALEAALDEVLPSALVDLLDAIHVVESHAPQQGLSSRTKRWWAAHQVRRSSDAEAFARAGA